MAPLVTYSIKEAVIANQTAMVSSYNITVKAYYIGLLLCRVNFNYLS